MNRRKELFALAAELSPAERAELLADVCVDDPALRTEIERLLAAYDQAGDFLESPAVDRTQIPPPRPLHRPGVWIGRYVLEEKVGEGGMGVVWRAEQREPVRRHVALKLLKPGTESQQLLRRFENERRALERMEHPNIAHVIDSGMTDEGSPFFVMELVRGAAITAYCDAHRLSIVDRLLLFIPVCRAVQHAHAKGIIHRDLKPSNILVTDEGGSPIPKVIDFGIARPVDRPAGETYHTRHLVLLGTPAYISPEQALTGSDVDTRADVYSLGAVLYELVCGAPPFDPAALMQLSATEMIRQLCDEEPPRPSRRFNQREATTAADARGGTPVGLSRQLSGDLDRIVMKAVEKHPSNRYETVAAFADDIERLLRHEPVAATRPSAMYYALKFARRHRTALIAGTLVVASLLGGTATAAWHSVRASRAEAATAAALRDERRARHLAATNEEKYRQQAYVSDVNLAGEADENDDPQRMKELLERHRPLSGQVDPRGFEWHYLWKRCTTAGEVIDRIDGGAYSVCLSPDESFLVAGGADGTIRFYEPGDWKRLAIIPSGQGDVNGLAISPDGTMLATAGEDGSVKLWRTSDRSELRRMQVFDKQRPGQGYHVAFAQVKGELLLAVCGQPEVIRLFDVETGASRGDLTGFSGRGEAIAVSNDGRLASATGDAIPRIWDLATRSIIKEGPKLSDGALFSTAFSSDGRFAAFGGSSREYVLWDTGGAEPPKVLPANPMRPREGEGVQSIAFAPDNVSAILGDRGGVIRFRRLDAAGAPWQNDELRWVAHDDQIQSFAMLRDGIRIVTASRNGELSAWNKPSVPVVRTVAAMAGPVADLSVGNGNSAAITGENGVWLWNVVDDRALTPIDRQWPATVVDQSHSGGFLAAGDNAGRVKVWGLGPRGPTELLNRVIDVNAAIVRIRLSSDGHYAAVLVSPNTERPKQVHLLDVRDGRILATHTVPGAFGLDFSPDGNTLAVDRESNVLLLNVPDLSIRETLVGHRQTVAAIRFSPDSSRLATGGNDRWITLWDTVTGQIINRWVAHGGQVTSIDFNPQGDRLVSTGGDGVLKLWEVSMGRLLLRLPRQDENHHPALFAADGDLVVVRGAQHGLIIHDSRRSDVRNASRPGTAATPQRTTGN